MQQQKLRFRLARLTTVLSLATSSVVILSSCSGNGPATAPPTTPCPSGETQCGGSCVDTATDAANCGDCGAACGEGESCEEGACRGEPGCPDGQADCGGACVDTSNDPQHCGDCGTTCGDGETCEGGECRGESGCPDGQADCGGACVDTSSDPQHCGDCGTTCSEGEACENGECREAGCLDGLTDCGGTCVDTQSDVAHCGDCATICADGETCEGGVCVGEACGSGLTQCGDACVDTQTDELHCGSCDAPCSAQEICQAGMCACSVGPGTSIGAALPQVLGGTTAGAPDAYSPLCGAAGAGEHVFSFTAPSAGLYSFDSSGSAYDTVVAVLDAAGCSELACDADPGGTARVSVDLASGQVVYLVVDGSGGAEGAFSLSVSRQSASSCPAGALGSTVPQTITGSTVGRPNSVTPTCNNAASPDAGYTFTAPIAGNYVFDTLGSTFDTVLHVHNSTCTGMELGCNDDSDSDIVTQSEITVSLAAGQTVVVMVDGYSGATGTFTLNVRRAVPPPATCDGTGLCGDAVTGCAACALENDCADELQTCIDDENCVNFVSCVRICGADLPCQSTCNATYPSGATLYAAVEQCVYCGECPNDCATAFTCP